MLGEVPEILVARNQREIMIDAGLRDQRVADIRLQPTAFKFGARFAGSPPIALADFQQEQFLESHRDRSRRFGIGHQFGDDRERQYKPSAAHGACQLIDIGAVVAR